MQLYKALIFRFLQVFCAADKLYSTNSRYTYFTQRLENIQVMNRCIMLWALAATTLATYSQACFVEQIAARAAEVSSSDDCVGSSVSASGSFSIENANVFTGSGFIGPQTVLVTNGEIVTVGGALIPGVKTVDGSGKFLIPGLIESHVHPQICTDLATLAGYGVTTAINMACLNYTQCATLKGQLGTTAYITAGEIACGNGSVHAKAFSVPPAEQIGPNTDLSALVDYTFGNGSYLFKIIAEAMGPTVQQQTEMVELTHQHGSLAATHATLLEYYEQAIQSKVDGIQHTPADGLLSSAQIEQILSQGQFVIPTMEFYRIVFSDPAILPIFGFPASSNYSNVQTNVANMHKAGIPLAAGTDAIGNFLGVNLPFGKTLHCELQNLVDAGLGNAEVLKAATSGAASLYRLNNRGSISTGMRADLVLLNSNPIEDIANTFDINAVWVGGIEIQNIQSQKGQTCSSLLS